VRQGVSGKGQAARQRRQGGGGKGEAARGRRVGSEREVVSRPDIG